MGAGHGGGTQAIQRMTNGTISNRCCLQPNPEVDRARRTCVMCLIPFCIWHRQAVSGACCRTTFRRSPRCAGISTTSVTAGFFEQSTIIWSWPREKPWGMKPVHQPVLLIAKSSKPQKVAVLRAMMPGRRQGTQTSYRRRHHRFSRRPRRSRSRHSRPGRSPRRAQFDPACLPMALSHLR